MGLEGKRALVTGSSRGIGKAIVLAFASEGADVIINYVGKADEAERTRAEAAKTSRRVSVIQADVSLPAKARERIDRSVAELGGLDILVNSAGIEKACSVSGDHRERVLRSRRRRHDLTGPFFLSGFCVSSAARQPPGQDYQQQLRARRTAFPALHPYCTAKGGL
jgi:NAD(P)-dependent dehydrogenase (short-subunit alcohol dehydrogenase family)